MTDLSNHKVLIAVFAMPDCGHCEEYLPRFTKKVKELGHPFLIYTAGSDVPPGVIPVLVYNVAVNNVDVQRFADRFQISATPTTLVLRNPIGTFKAEGALDNRQIEALLGLASQALNG